MRSKDKSNRGKVLQWFKDIEATIIANSITREVKQEFQVSEGNELAPVIKRKKITLDGRKKEWVLMKGKENEIDIRRVVEKKERKVLVEKWPDINKEGARIRLVANKEINSDKPQQQWVQKKEIFTALQGAKRQESDWVFNISADMVKSSLEKRVVKKEELDRIARASLTGVISIEGIEIELIKRQGFSHYCENLLLEQLGKNISIADNCVVFYTDGSLCKESSEREKR